MLRGNEKIASLFPFGGFAVLLPSKVRKGSLGKISLIKEEEYLLFTVMLKDVAQKALNTYKTDSLEEQKYLEEMKIFLLKNQVFASRSNVLGHFTGSAWVVNPTFSHTLLIHHKKLNSWFQPGGHAEIQDMSLRDTAIRETQEELGIEVFQYISDSIFDIDIHTIPEKNSEPAHLHYDVRYLIVINDRDALQHDTLETYGAKWVAIESLLADFSLSIRRMAQKTKLLSRKTRS